MKICYMVKEKNGRTFKTRIGVAFPEDDGSLKVWLDAFPVSGELRIEEYVPRAGAAPPPPPPKPTAPDEDDIPF